MTARTLRWIWIDRHLRNVLTELDATEKWTREKWYGTGRKRGTMQEEYGRAVNTNERGRSMFGCDKEVAKGLCSMCFIGVRLPGDGIKLDPERENCALLTIAAQTANSIHIRVTFNVVTRYISSQEDS